MKKHLMKFALMLVTVGWVGGAASSAHAERMTLQDLLNGGSITVGNKVFTGFANFESTAGGTSAVDPSQVMVVPTIDGGKIGITFQGNGQFFAGQNMFQNTQFEFNVVSAETKFNMAILSLNASAHETATGAQITGELNNNLPGLSVRTSTPFNSSISRFETPEERIHAKLTLRLGGGADQESLTSVDAFSFSVEEPEPASLTLLAIGSVGLIGYRWRRNRRAVA